MFSRILVPTDFSAPSDAALDYARTLAAKFRGTLHLLHVVEDPIAAGPVPEMYFGGSFPTRGAARRSAEVQLERICEGDPALFGATTEVVFGHTAPTIVNYAAEKGFSLIVMGTHGRSRLAHLFMGGVAEHVIRAASCPVLSVHAAPKLLSVPAGDCGLTCMAA
jgi:universal stress protein A